MHLSLSAKFSFTSPDLRSPVYVVGTAFALEKILPSKAFSAELKEELKIKSFSILIDDFNIMFKE